MERITIDNFDVKSDQYMVSKEVRSFSGKDSYVGAFKKEKNGKAVVATVWLKGCRFHGWHKSDFDKLKDNLASTCLTWEVDSEYGIKIKKFSDDVVSFYNTDGRAAEIRKLNKVSDKIPIIPPISLSKDGKYYRMYTSISPEAFINPKTGKPLPATTVHSKDSKTGKVTEHSIKAFEQLEFDCNFAEISFELSGLKNYIKVKLFNIITGDKFKRVVFGSKEDLYAQITTESSPEDDGVMDLNSALRSISNSDQNSISINAAAGEGPETSAISLNDIKTRNDDSESSEDPPPIIKPNVISSKSIKK